jgi:type IV pilus assembly protein PilN
VIRINLLPVREARRKAGFRQQLMILGGSVGAAVLGALLFHQAVLSDIRSGQTRITELRSELDRYKPQQERMAAFKAKKVEIEGKLEVIARLERSRSGPVRIMDELATRIPERVWLTNVNAQDGQIELKGMSLDNELVALFLTNLGESAYFMDIELEETELRQVDELKLNTFQIKARLTAPADEDAEADEPGGAAAPVAGAR